MKKSSNPEEEKELLEMLRRMIELEEWYDLVKMILCEIMWIYLFLWLMIDLVLNRF